MKKCDNFIKFLHFMHNIIKDIENKLETEANAILTEINNIKKDSLKNKNLTQQWIDNYDFDEEEKELLLKFSERIDKFLQDTKSPNISEKDLEELYKNDEFLIYRRVSSHFENVEKLTLSLIVRFQVIDRMRQQIEHLVCILDEILRNTEPDEDNLPKFLTLFNESSEFFSKFKGMMNTVEEKDEFYRIFNITIDESRENEIFEAF